MDYYSFSTGDSEVEVLKKNILLIHTGGTISMSEDTSGSVKPGTNNPLKEGTSLLSKLANLVIEEPFNLPSPHITPKEMMHLGIFAGDYFYNDIDEFPADWFEGVHLSPGHPDTNLSFFKTMASQPLKEWQRKGWIFEEDPRGRARHLRRLPDLQPFGFRTNSDYAA